jgi:glycosyltransferase involved in cell wall biosynthesis
MKIGLCMIVKNESHVIERAIRSALRFMDTWCIVDTGSSDDTMAIIRRVANELGKPGVLYERPWVNFGVNRTQLLELAKEHMDWMWMLDADDTIDGHPISVSDLSSEESGYKVEVHHGGMKQERPHLFNSKFGWIYVGAVHEYAHCPAKLATKRLPSTIWITARTEGHRSQDSKKYERDAELLEDEIATGKADMGRSLFYLAQSYRDAGNSAKAKEVYLRRIEHGGWIQETYICYVNVIKLTDDFKEKLALAWKAQELVPTRREAVYEVLVVARKNGHFTQEMYALGVAFRDVPLNTGNLFNDTHCYGWSYDDELAVVAYYAHHPRQSLESALRAFQSCPDFQKKRIQDNIRFAKDKLKNESVRT